MQTNISNIKLIGVSILSMLAFAVAGLFITNGSASAVVDTCTWTGEGTGTPDSGDMTLTFNVNEAANWMCSIDGVAVPEAGDTLEFPANLADVDPGDTIDDNDEWQWKYIVNNDLPADTSFEGVEFTGNAGEDQANDDGYKLEGNAIQLNGDVTVAYRAPSGEQPEIGLDMEILGDVTVQAEVANTSTVSYGSNTLTLSGTEASPLFQGTLNGTGVIELGQVNFVAQEASTIGASVIVLENEGVNVNLSTSILNDENITVTVEDGASLYVFSGDPETTEVLMNITYIGNGLESSYATSNSQSADRVAVENLRGSFSGQQYNSETQTFNYFGLEMVGDITLSSNTIFQLDSDLDISGSLAGDFSVGVFPGSRGSLTISSADNNSATENGTVTPSRFDYELVDSSFDVWIQSGADAMLDEDEEITVKAFVQDNGRLMGSGTVAGLEVRSGGIVAPGESPGCIVSDGDLTLNGTYEFEILNSTACTGHDQLDVTGEVDVTGATLDLTLLEDYGFDEGEEFVLIANDGSDGVTGEFAGLAEGDEIEEDGNTFVLSYEGGDGNDVTLTAESVSSSNPGSAGSDSDSDDDEDGPGVPDTGVGSLIQNPLVTIIAAGLTGGMVIGLRKFNSAK